jgi:regulator of protease activity HflC (stomatin/prohibitin superfamily)
MELLLPLLLAAVVYSFISLRVVRQYERGVAFFLGRYWGTKGPGLIFLPAGFASQKRVSLRIVALDIPPQDVITRDNVSVKVNAVLYMRVSDPAKAIIEIEDYRYATSQLAQTTLRSVLGEVELDELLSDREKINAVLKKIIDERTDPWGIEVSAVEVKDVDLPDQMKRAMARQAEAERERRAKVIAAQGELQASQTLAEAAHMLATEPIAIQLRYLQTVTEIAAENNSTTIFPIPIELFRPFRRSAPPAGDRGDRSAEPPGAALHAGLSSMMSKIAWAGQCRPGRMVDGPGPDRPGRARADHPARRRAPDLRARHGREPHFGRGDGARPRGRHSRALPPASAAGGRPGRGAGPGGRRRLTGLSAVTAQRGPRGRAIGLRSPAFWSSRSSSRPAAPAGPDRVRADRRDPGRYSPGDAAAGGSKRR